MTTKNLLEAATLVEASETGTWRVRLISEGKGSSGIYPETLMEDYSHAFNGALSFENHPVGWDGPQGRNFTQIVGKVVGETWVDTDERGKKGIYANWEPDPDHRERLTRYKENLGLSIYIEGDGHVDEDGEFVVDSFNANDPFRSVDVVIAAGRGGRFEESALREIYSSRRGDKEPSVETSARGNKKKDTQDMEIEELGKAVEALTQTVQSLVDAGTAKAEEAAQIEADNAAVEERVAAVTAGLDAVESAREDLLPTQVDRLRAEAKKGVDVAPLIEQAKADMKAMAESYGERLTEGAGGLVKGSGRKVESAVELGKVFG